MMGTTTTLPARPTVVMDRVSLLTLSQYFRIMGLPEPPWFKLPRSVRTDRLTWQLAMLWGIQSISNPIGPIEIPPPQLQLVFNSQWSCKKLGGQIIRMLDTFRETLAAALAGAEPLPVGHHSLGSCTSIAPGSNLTVLHPLGVFLLHRGLAAPLLHGILAARGLRRGGGGCHRLSCCDLKLLALPALHQALAILGVVLGHGFFRLCLFGMDGGAS